jgi:hypothetical protein
MFKARGTASAVSLFAENTRSRVAFSGWGIPMATDIVFAFALLGFCWKTGPADGTFVQGDRGAKSHRTSDLAKQ